MKKTLIILVLFLFSIGQVSAKVCVSEEELFDMGLVAYLEVATKLSNRCVQNAENYDYEVFRNYLIKYKDINHQSDENLDALFQQKYSSDAKIQKMKFLMTIVDDYEENVINKSNLNSLCKGFVKELNKITSGGEKELRKGIKSFTDQVNLSDTFPRCEAKKIFKPVWEQVDTLVCDEQVKITYKKNLKEETVDTEGVKKWRDVFVFDFKKDKIHEIDADEYNESGKKEYTTSLYADFKMRGDIIHKEQQWDNPNLRTVNDFIFGKTANRFNFFNISYKDDRWIMIHSSSHFNPMYTNEMFTAKMSKYFCRSEDGFIEELGLYKLF